LELGVQCVLAVVLHVLLLQRVKALALQLPNLQAPRRSTALQEGSVFCKHRKKKLHHASAGSIADSSLRRI